MTTSITSLPSASLPLTGAERVPLDQTVGSPVAAASLAVGTGYRIETVGSTNWTACGLPAGVTAAAGLTFVATAAGTGTGTAIEARTVEASAQAIADLAGAAGLTARLNAFRDAATFYVSKRISASDSNNGTSPGEPFLTIGAAYAAANAYVVANPGVLARIEVGPGVFTEPSLPFRSRPNIYAKGASQRSTTIKPAAGQEFNGFFALDSGCMVEGFRFAGHQATGTSATDSNVGTRAWAIRFNEQANGGLGPIITASPYVKDCASITAEDDEGLAGSTSTGDTGGGIEVDGAKCHPSSPVRSMVVYGYTQQNLGGPGVVIKNDAYCELVSFFGLFCTWHVRAETGGWATLSGGGCSEFGLYGIVANGYSPTALYTGSVRVVALAGATQVDVISLTANRIGSSNRPHNGQVVIFGANTYVVSSSVPINSLGVEVADDSPTRAGYRVNIFNPNGSGLVANVPQGTTADFRRISRVSAGAHTALFVGSGTNYNALPWNGGIPVRANQFVEENFGRVYGLSVNDAGDIYAASGAFQIDGTTGSVTISTDQFNLSGLDGIGPFRRGGGAPVGVQAKEFSNSITLLASTGVSGSDTLPTQFAVRSYVDNRFLTNITATAGQPLTISDTSTQDVQGFWTRSRNIAIATGYSIPADTRQDDWDAAFTQRRTWDGGSQHLNAATGRTSLGLSSAATATIGTAAGNLVALDGSARLPAVDGSQLTGLPAASVTSVAGRTGAITLAVGDVANAVATTDARLSDARTPLAHNQAWSTITGTPTTLAGYGITDGFNPAIPGSIGGTTPAAGTFTTLSSAVAYSSAPIITASAGTYTLDAAAANEFVASATVAENITITASNLGSVPTGRLWRGVFEFVWSSGAVTLAAPAGVTARGVLPTLQANRTYIVIAKYRAGGTTLDYIFNQDGIA